MYAIRSYYALAVPGDFLRDRVFGAANAARRERGVLFAHPREIHQFDTEARVGQGAGWRHPFSGRIGLVAHRCELGIVLPRIVEQAGGGLADRRFLRERGGG